MYLSTKSGRQAAWYFRPFFALQRRKYGQELRAATVWARVPVLYWVLMAFYAALERRRSPISPALRALLQTYISQLNHCEFCIDLNAANAAKRYGNLSKVLAVSDWENSALFDDRERISLEYARAMTLSGYSVDQSLMSSLRGHFSETAVIELTALVSFQNMSSKFNAALDIESMGLCAPMSKSSANAR